MKRLLSVITVLTLGVSLHSQIEIHQACYLDTTYVDELYSRKDTMWVIKPQYSKGDWNLYYDFGLSKIKSENHYNNSGGKVGVWKEYYRSGKPLSYWDYSAPLNVYYPPGKEWFENGNIRKERTQSADTVTETHFHLNGKVKAINKWNKTGVLVHHREWCDNGQLMIDYNPSAAVPVPVKTYYCNGSVKSEYNWYMYGYTGSFKENHPNGKPAVSGQFTEKPADQPVYMARKTGEWIYYDEKGNLTKKEVWKNGQLVSTGK